VTNITFWNRSAFALVLFFGVQAAVASPSLTIIQDTLYKADGTRFDGTAFVQWKSFEAGDQSNIPMQSFTVRITSGALRVSVVPTTNASAGAYYEVKYNSNGRIQFVEYWAVPPSSVPLRLRDVRTAAPPSSVTAPTTAASTLIQDVTGLREELDARPTKGVGYGVSRTAVINSSGQLEAALGSLGDCVRVDGSAGPCGNAGGNISYTDGESPAGAVDGSNTSFTLAGSPSPGASLQLYRNGLLQQQGTDYNLSGNVLTVSAGSIPVTGDTLQCWYRTSGIVTNGVQYSDGEVPSGAVNGTNAQFTVLAAPNPLNSLQLFRNGVLQKQGLDYSVSSQTLTFIGGAIPQIGDTLVLSYRY
jgi:hypothetical protein